MLNHILDLLEPALVRALVVVLMEIRETSDHVFIDNKCHTHTRRRMCSFLAPAQELCVPVRLRREKNDYFDMLYAIRKLSRSQELTKPTLLDPPHIPVRMPGFHLRSW